MDVIVTTNYAKQGTHFNISLVMMYEEAGCISQFSSDCLLVRGYYF